MSLINKMLQELDARGNARAGELPSDVKPVGREAGRHPRRRIAAITAALLALALGAAAVVLLPIKGKSFEPRPAVPVAQAPAPAPVPVPAPAPVPSEPVTVAEVAPPAAAPAPAATPDVEEAAPARSERVAPAATEKSSRTVAAPPRAARERPVAAAPTAPAVSTTTWAVASERARAEEARLAQRWAAEESRIAGLPASARPAAQRRLAAEKDKAARRARVDAAWIAALKRKEIAAGTFPGEAGDNGYRGAGAAQGRSESTLQHADNQYRRALASLQEARVGEAIAGLQQALRLNPKHDAARQTLVGLLIENKRNDEAMAELQQALALDARQPALAMLLARLQIERGGSGIETLLRTLPYAAGNAEYQGFLAGALQRQDRHREAVDQYGAALRGAPGNAVWWMGLGISLQAEKRNADAAEAFRRARAAGTLSPELQGFVERRLQQVGR